eukprot:4681422-Alexandrium_andersonii.AAC.1
MTGPRSSRGVRSAPPFCCAAADRHNNASSADPQLEDELQWKFAGPVRVVCFRPTTGAFQSSLLHPSG